MLTIWFIIAFVVGSAVGADWGFRLGQRFMFKQIVNGVQKHLKDKGDGRS